jgi:hypothetical protein
MVYRSSLLLDSDLAARSAALGQIYNNLGFQQLGLVEGWKSVNTDPTNFSAHRLLADTYATLPRHEIARVSELLQSQLLQPLNMTPIQPRLAESNLFLISAGGPASLSFNEFNPLFNRNGINFQTTGLAGENSTYAGEGILSGIYQKASFSLGGFHFQTDGWRPNANQNDFIGDAFLQVELSPQTSVQAEVRRRETQLGDIQQRFFLQDFFPGLTENRDSFTTRLGARHSFAPDSILLGSFMFQDRGDAITNRIGDFVVETKLPESAVAAELQHIFRSQYFNLTSGIGYFDVHGKLRSRVIPPLIEPVNVDEDIRHFNAYAYANINPFSNLTITAGGSIDYLNGDAAAVPGQSLTQFNPKFGITWNVLSNTTLRAAVSRIVKRTLITNQTLEPTQVAGFNQFFDDVDVTKAWRYGAAIDQKFTQTLFGGAEFSRRTLDIPLIDATVTPPAIQKVNGKENLARTYLFWTPYTWVALRTEYLFEHFENGPALGEHAHVNTHRVPLGVNVFHASGLSASFTATYYNQAGRFMRLTTPALQSAATDFWTIDAAINYRLPQRYGFVTLGAANLLDRKFKYLETDLNNPHIQPARTVFFKLTLALP